MIETFADSLIDRIKQKKSYICIGLDPNFEGEKAIPGFLLDSSDGDYNRAIFKFNKAIIDNTHNIAPVYKPQSAFYEKYNAHNALKNTIDYLHQKNCLVILDAKRNDIGNTSKAYADAIFGKLNADAVTINGYLGSDCIKPFMDYKDKGLFVLVKTSNRSSSEFQDLFSATSVITDYFGDLTDDTSGYFTKEQFDKLLNNVKFSNLAKNEMLFVRNYIKMARMVKNWSDEWNNSSKSNHNYTNIGAVVGATFPQQMKELRKEIPESIFLIPGYGAQGGSAKDIVYGFNPDGFGAIINSSRGINYAYVKAQDGNIFKPEEFGEAAKFAAEKMQKDLNKALGENISLPW